MLEKILICFKRPTIQMKYWEKKKFEAQMEIERIRREREAVKRKNIANYFVHFSKRLRPWIKKMAEKYKERGDFPLMPMLLLPSYYEDVRDKEVAIFAALLVKDDGNFERIQAFRELLGKSPWEWFENREFVRLSIGKTQNCKTGGTLNSNIAKLMNNLWTACFDGFLTYDTIGDCVAAMARRHRITYFDVLTRLTEDCVTGNYLYKIRLLLMVLCTSDGIGLSLWRHLATGEKIQCPICHRLKLFLGTWFPDWRRAGDVDSAIRLFGLDREYDFFYAWLCYTEMQKRNPKECSQYATRYATWYRLDSDVKRIVWLSLQPTIPF